MGVIGTFGSFAAARMGIYASQASLNVTGNNIANINTKGYTRQHMDLVSLHSGGSDRYQNQMSINVGYGVLCTGVGQSRDPYLDIRYRNENSSVGAMEAKLKGLTELSNILDEVGMGSDGEGVIEAQFNTIYEQLEILSRNVGSEEYDTLVRSSASTLCQLFNTYAKELDTVKENQVANLEQNVERVNEILTSIRDLNEQIRNAGIHGDRALELRDTRNVLIDELSSFVKIDVKYGNEYLDQYSEPIEKLEISLADSDIKLVDSIYVVQFDMPEEVAAVNKDYAPESNNAKKYMYEDALGHVHYIHEDDATTDENGLNPTYKAPATKATLYENKEANSQYPYYYTIDGKTYYAEAEASIELKKETIDGNEVYTFEDPLTKEKISIPVDKIDEYTEKAEGSTDDNPKYVIKLTKNPVYGDAYYLDANKEKVYISKDDPSLKIVGNSIELEAAGERKLTENNNGENAYNEKYAYRYMGEKTDEDGNPVIGPVKDIEDATTTFNYSKEDPTKEGSQYLLHLSALTNATGKVLKVNGVESLDQMLDDVTLYGALQANRELLTEKGEFATALDMQNDSNANVKRGIPYYEKALDALAKKFADTMNEANSLPADVIYKRTDAGNAFVDSTGQVIQYTYTDADGNQKTENVPVPTEDKPITAEQLDALREKGVLKKEYSTYNGGNLFSNAGDSNDGSGITAKNIAISKDWATGTVRILNTKEPDTLGIGNSTAKDNINHMITLMTSKLEYKAGDVSPDAKDKGVYFKGTFQEFFAGITNTLASDANTTTTLFNSYDAAALALDNDRSSVSGVDLNEEATNMMQFQKSYSAACRLLTTIDSMLDKLINGTAL